MKTKEELNKLKEDYESLKIKLTDLNDEELDEVAGGGIREFFEKIGEGTRNITKPTFNSTLTTNTVSPEEILGGGTGNHGFKEDD